MSRRDFNKIFLYGIFNFNYLEAMSGLMKKAYVHNTAYCSDCPAPCIPSCPNTAISLLPTDVFDPDGTLYPDGELPTMTGYEAWIFKDDCIGCGLCTNKCPFDAISLN